MNERISEESLLAKMNGGKQKRPLHRNKEQVRQTEKTADDGW